MLIYRLHTVSHTSQQQWKIENNLERAKKSQSSHKQSPRSFKEQDLKKL